MKFNRASDRIFDELLSIPVVNILATLLLMWLSWVVAVFRLWFRKH